MAGDDLSGRRLGGFELIELLGEGSFGSVWRARQVRLDRDVAVKVLDPLVARDPNAARRFEREGRSAASLDHPAIVPVYEAGDDDGLYYLAMRLVDGETLADVIDREAPLTEARTAELLGPIAAALDAAHSIGLIHRDVKPANVLIENDRPYLSDFGIAASARELGRYTTGSIGTAEYMAPEQARGDEVDHRSDLYALGCVAFHAVTGRSPFARNDIVSTLLAHSTDPVPDTGDLGLDAFFARALAKHPDDRFDSGAAFMAAFSVDLTEPLDHGSGARRRGARRRGIAAAMAVVGALSFGVASVVVQGDGSRSPVTSVADADLPSATDRTVPASSPVTAEVGDGEGDEQDGGGDGVGSEGSVVDPGSSMSNAGDEELALRDGGRVRVGTTLDLADLNPHSSLDTSKVLSEWVLPVMYRIDENLEPVPSLAVGPPEPSPDDPLRLSWEIRDDRVWDDGEPVTADDIVATYEYLVDPDTNAESTLLYNSVAAVTSVSRTEVAIELSEPNGAAHLMFSTVHPIIQASAWNEHVATGGSAADFLVDGVDFAAGPYRMATGRQNPGEIELVPNAAWTGETRPRLESVEIANYPNSLALVAAKELGEVDLIWVDDVVRDEIREAQAIDATEVRVGTSNLATQLTFNLRSAPLQDLRVRQAIELALDRNAIVDTAVGRKTDSVVDPWNSLVFAPGQRDDSAPFADSEQDAERAAELLDEAGWMRPAGENVVRRNAAGDDLELILVLLNEADSINAAASIEIALKELGIQVTALPAGNDLTNERINTGDFDLLLQFRIFNNDPVATEFSFASYGCPSTIEGCSGNGVNVGAFSDPAVDELLLTADATIDPQARLDLYVEIDRLLAEQLPAVPLFVDPAFTAYDDDITGVVMALNLGPLTSLADWALLAG